MAALAAFGIDNAVVEVEGNELPILDGSAAPWCAALREAGTVRQAGGRSILRIIEPVEFVEGGRSIRIEPYEGYALRVEMDLAGFGTMIWDGDLTADRFEQELAPSRSFGRIKWALPLKIYQFVTGRDVLRGAHLGNVAAIWGSRVIGGMRLPGEPARHRALDLIGDLAMAGAPLQGRVSALRPGHEINHAFLRKLMETPQAWERVEL